MFGRWVVVVAASLFSPAVFSHSPFYDPEDDAIIPLGALAEGTTMVELSGNDYLFRFSGSEIIEYRIDRAHPDFSEGVLRVVEASSGARVMRGGQIFKYGSNTSPYGNVWTPEQVPQNVDVTLLSEELVDGQLVLEYRHIYDGVTHRIRYEIGIRGKSLRVRSFSLTPENTAYDNNYHGFDPGEMDGLPENRFVRIPYMENIPVTLFAGQWLVSSFSDANRSRGGGIVFRESGEGSNPVKNARVAHAIMMSDGSINHAVDDVIWTTVSSQIEDLFVDTENYPLSPHRPVADRMAVVRDSGNSSWSVHRDGYRYKFDAGFFNSQNYFWDWHYYAINVNEPTYYPARSDLGPKVDLDSYVDAFKQDENQVGFYYTLELMDQGYSSDCSIFRGEGGANPSYDPTYANKNARGGYKNGWNTSNPLDNLCGPGLGQPVRVLATNHLLFYLFREYGLPQSNYSRQNLSYIDAKHTLPINHNIDQEAGSDKTSNLRDGLLAHKAFFNALKAVTGGSLLGEGTQFRAGKGDLEVSGYGDGIRRFMIPPSGIKQSDWFLLPDYELRVIRPKTLHHGMGVESQFNGFDEYKANQDDVRCAEIIYGHGIYLLTNGRVPNDWLQDPDELRAYYQVTADLQPLFATAGVESIRYWNSAAYVDLTQALFDDYDFSNSRLRIEYDNGLVIYANASSVDDWTVALAGESFLLGRDAWAIHHPASGYLNFSAIPEGGTQRFDYVRMPGKYEMIDGRGTISAYGNLTAENFLLVFDNGYRVEETGTFPDDFTMTGEVPARDLPYPADPWPPTGPFDAAADFRPIQGIHNWFYRAYDLAVTVPPDRTFWLDYHRYPELDYDGVSEQYHHRDDPGVAVGAASMKPSATRGAVRGWFALVPGEIAVTGAVQKTEAGGDGVDVRIRDGFEGPVLWSASISGTDTGSYEHDFNYSATMDQTNILLFEVESKGDATADTVTWAPLLTYTCPVPVGQASLTVRQAEVTELSWSTVLEATAYDIVSGGLILLASSSGDFSTATDTCLADDHPTNTLQDGRSATSGDGFWYLVRPINACGPGSYESTGSSQVERRDQRIANSPQACP